MSIDFDDKKNIFLKQTRNVIKLDDEILSEFVERRKEHKFLHEFEAELYDSGYKENEVNCILDYFIDVLEE